MDIRLACYHACFLLSKGEACCSPRHDTLSTGVSGQVLGNCVMAFLELCESLRVLVTLLKKLYVNLCTRWDH